MGRFPILFFIALASFFASGSALAQEPAQETYTLPPQPSEKDWKFVQELQQPLYQKFQWAPRQAAPGEADFASGVSVETNFPDPLKRLDTAYADLNDFMKATGIKQGGPFKIITEKIDHENLSGAAGSNGIPPEGGTPEQRPPKGGTTNVSETYRIIVSANECKIQAGDAEGIRRGIFYLEDKIQSARGPFLPLGALTRTPVIRTRISRCFFGPIKRAPRTATS